MSSTSVTTDEARLRILADHAQLRTLTGAVVACAQEARRDEKQRPQVREALIRLRTELELHLTYEEKTLVPLLEQADAWGPGRAAHMAKDHDGQRAVLLALTEDAGEGVRSVEALADELDWFVQSFERDMVEEERTLLAPATLADTSVGQGGRFAQC
jgi:Hemerythrin HHE cation binding domain